jgi:hypothetical protein
LSRETAGSGSIRSVLVWAIKTDKARVESLQYLDFKGKGVFTPKVPNSLELGRFNQAKRSGDRLTIQ